MKTVIELFVEIATQNPNNTALISDTSVISYSELLKHSQAFGSHLLSLGLKKGDVVGVSIDKSNHLIFCLLGILIAGGVYLPLDPQYPKDRLKLMCQSAQAKFLIADSVSIQEFPFFDLHVLFENDLYYENLNLTNINNLPTLSDMQEAYIIFTSGSTGIPKGVPIKHIGLANAIVERMPFYSDPIKTLLISSINFDMSLMSIFHSILSGGTLVLPNKGKINFENLVKCIYEYEIDYILCVPVFYELLLYNNISHKKLKNVVLAGESFHSSIVDLHENINPQAFLYNEYGLTECSICSTVGMIYDPRSRTKFPITVGKPIKNTDIHIIDDSLKELQNGNVGEICISGIGVMKGFINDAKLTSDKITTIQTKHGKEINQVYRTGDLGKILETGELVLSGRVDRQIKFKGYRIELEEVERAISEFPNIDRAIVEQLSNSNRKILITYYISRKKISSDEIKQFLKKRIPIFSIPSEFIHLTDFPLTPNGKIDHQELVKRYTANHLVRNNDGDLQGVEKSLFQIWRDVLGHDNFGIRDNFFDVGGDSLQVTEVQTLIEKKMQIGVPIALLFQFPTIKQFSDYISNKEMSESNQKDKLDRSTEQKAAFTRFKKNSKRGS